MTHDDAPRPRRTSSFRGARERARALRASGARVAAPWRRDPSDPRAGKKAHRNGRGLFVGAVIGGVLGYFAGRAIGQGALGIVFGALIGAAVLYRLNPGPWGRNPK